MARSFLVTGANSGCGLEATRQLVLHFSQQQQQYNDDNGNDNVVKIYLLCRSEEKAREAMADIGTNDNDNNIHLEFLKFDAYDDVETIRKNIQLSNEDETICGILLNAGGFGDGNKNNTPKNASSSSTAKKKNNNNDRACSIAQLNIIGHAALVNHLIVMGKMDDSTRIVAAGSEASFSSPGVTNDYRAADFVAHLSGTVAAKERSMGLDYGWTKGILALYWAAFARHHPELYVLTVSPGAVSNTKLLSHGGVSPFLRGVARLSLCFGGSHNVEVGAKRYVDVLISSNVPNGNNVSNDDDDDGDNTNNNENTIPASGSFLASRKGFTKDFGNIASLQKGRFVTDMELQDKAWDAVNKFL